MTKYKIKKDQLFPFWKQLPKMAKKMKPNTND